MPECTIEIPQSKPETTFMQPVQKRCWSFHLRLHCIRIYIVSCRRTWFSWIPTSEKMTFNADGYGNYDIYAFVNVPTNMSEEDMCRRVLIQAVKMMSASGHEIHEQQLKNLGLLEPSEDSEDKYR